MTTKEAITLTRQLQEAAWRLEQQYIDNGGEVTDETEALEAEKAALSEESVESDHSAVDDDER